MLLTIASDRKPTVNKNALNKIRQHSPKDDITTIKISKLEN